MKTNKKILIAATICTLAGAVITAAATSALYDASQKSVNTVTKTISPDILKINISTDAGKIKVTASDTDEITLTYSEDGTTRYTVTEENYTLSVSPEKTKKSKAEWYDYYFSLDFHSNDVILNVPQDFSAKTELNADFGNIDVNELSGSLTAECDYSDIKINGGDFSKINLKSDCGNIKLTDVSGLDFDMECDLGDIRGTIAGKHSDYDIWAVSEVGKCNIAPSADGPLRLSVQTNLGDIDIHFTQ